ncbi:hypothetical protein D0T57_13625 [Dysgonomonas sp. 511]|nr:hypothetical protein [Dysgonomonas sp. 511]
METVTDYVGNKIYENGQLKRILIDGGYIEDDKYYFYLTDHLGNNRVVVDEDGNVVQQNDYYPFGMAFADNENEEVQPYKYNGKELDRKHGLNLYDYHARYYDSTVPRFTTVDPLAEKYYSISPYVYCGNNPIKLVDVNGKEWGIVVNANGTMTITLNVGFSVSSNLNLTAAQIDSYKAAISAQLNSTFMEVSGGRISATMNFDGGKDPSRFTPSVRLEGGDGMAAGMYIMGQELVGLYVENARSITEFGETGVHELLHTLGIDDLAATTYISDTKMTRGNGTYLTTSTTAKDIHKNVMNYSQTKIDGKSFKDLYNSYSGMNRITPGQLNFLIKSIYKQMQGYGQRPIRKTGETDEEFGKRYKKYYDDYWNNPEEM